MDEHDKRAREVREKVLHALTSGDAARAAGATDFIASALRAAVAAERERVHALRHVLIGIGNDACADPAWAARAAIERDEPVSRPAWQPAEVLDEGVWDGYPTAPISPAPAQAEQRVSERLRSIAESMVTVWASSTECAACKRDLRRHPHGTVTYKRAPDAEPIEVACPVARLRSEADALEQGERS